MIQKFIQILDQVVEDFNLDKNVVGVILFGSLAKGKENSYSEIDLMVIAKKTEVKTTNELYGDTLAQMLWRPLRFLRTNRPNKLDLFLLQKT